MAIFVGEGHIFRRLVVNLISVGETFSLGRLRYRLSKEAYSPSSSLPQRIVWIVLLGGLWCYVEVGLVLMPWSNHFDSSYAHRDI